VLATDGIEKIECIRRSRVFVFASSQLDIDMLAPLYEALIELGPCERLDVLFYSRGGAINAARRIALLFREFSEHISFLVPHYCESAGTVVTMSANEIVAGPLAVFSPIDPILSAAPGRSGGPLAMSAQDLRLFGQMCTRWFGFNPQQANAQALKTLGDSIFPTTLTSFYRSTLEIEHICAELLGLHMGDEHNALKEDIAQRLIFGFHSHTFALTRNDLKSLGLPVSTHRDIEEPMWNIARGLRGSIGSGARHSEDDESWLDAFIATRDGAVVRRRRKDLPGRWETRA
jgi:hypothetical protein